MRPSDQHYVVPPFPAFPSIARYVPVGTIADAMTRVCRSIDAFEALSLVIGPPGTGKSLLAALLADRYSETHDVVVLGESTIDSRAGYLRQLLYHLGVDYRSINESDLHLTLVERLCSPASTTSGLLIIVDEAQSIEPEVLEAIRMSTNIHRKGQPRVFAVVVGGARLDDTLASPELESFTQRISARCYLHPMNYEETRRYVTETISVCGASPESTITHEAISAVHHACCGVPRLINQVLTEAIDIAEESGESLIGEATIESAWAKLQQLPSPMIDSPVLDSENTTVEFGELDEEQATLPQQSSEAVASIQDSFELNDNFEPNDSFELNDNFNANDSFDANDAFAEQFFEPSVSQSLADLETNIALLSHPDIFDAELATENRDPLEAEHPHYSPAPQTLSDEKHCDGCCGKTDCCNRSDATESLFGEFDEEEEVRIGKVVSSKHSFATSAVTFDRETSGSPATKDGDDLDTTESVPDQQASMTLHQEIVGIADSSNVARLLAIEEAAESPAADVFHEEPVVETADFEASADMIEAEMDEQDNAILKLPNRDELLPSQNEKLNQDLDIVVRDDSDLLVIEDDLDLSRGVKATRIDREEHVVSVDHKTLLQRMRTGTES